MTWAASMEDPMRKGLIQKITNTSIFLKILQFVVVDGMQYEYGEQATTGGIAFRKLNEGYAAEVGVVNPKVEKLGIMGGLVQTDRQFTNKQGDRVRASAISAKVQRAGLFYDKYVIQGDPASDPNQFLGLNARLTGNQVLSAGTNGGALTLSMVDQLLDAVVGPNSEKVLVTNKVDRRSIKQLVVAAAGGAGVTDVGAALPNYDGATIHTIDEDGDDQPILTKTETQGSSAVTSSMYCIRPGKDPEGEWVQGLVSSKMIEVIPPPAGGPVPTAVYDLIEGMLGLAVFHGRSAARLKGIL
jgi:hypothetical protein